MYKELLENVNAPMEPLPTESGQPNLTGSKHYSQSEGKKGGSRVWKRIVAAGRQSRLERDTFVCEASLLHITGL